MQYAELCSQSNFSFLHAASHPAELVERAAQLAYNAIALTDECSLAGIVKAHVAALENNIKLIIGAKFVLSDGTAIIVIAPSKQAYQELSGYITLTRMRSPKGAYEAHFQDLQFRLKSCFILLLADPDNTSPKEVVERFYHAFKTRLWIAIHYAVDGSKMVVDQYWGTLEKLYPIPFVACGNVLMHDSSRKSLLDILYSINKITPIQQMGVLLEQNEDRTLHHLRAISKRYPAHWIDETVRIADACTFELSELKYQYPEELVPYGQSAIDYLREITYKGAKRRWQGKVPSKILGTIKKELEIIEMMSYEYFFLTVYDIVSFAQRRHILYQGRGSAANSVICYCLFITEISPDHINALFERFISKERGEPPDIDVDFENERREEVIQYIYKKYGREHAALAATVVTYQTRSAIRDVGKAMGFDRSLIEYLAKTVVRWESKDELVYRAKESGIDCKDSAIHHFFDMVGDIIGFPRHLSQHVGGFIIAQDRVSDLVPIENTSMADRSVIQWDKNDLESLGLLKVDVLALGMLTALRKMLVLVNRYEPTMKSLADLPFEDPATYDLICAADTIGVFQIESRAQMTMLPRLKPRCFYDLVIEIAIVRPGPILGDMVHPYLRRRKGIDPVIYEDERIEATLSPTLGVPIFQEQVIRIAMVAAGFTGGEADQLRRAMTNWGKNSKLLSFEKKFIGGMLQNGYRPEFAHKMFEQIKGFGGYGFPEAHSASFAILCYASCFFKKHHPEAFYCALLNSQPMGFYSTSQLVEDAKRHNIILLPIDVQKSEWDTLLVKVDNTSAQPKKALRLGFHLIKGFRVNYAQIISQVRKVAPFTSLNDFMQRTRLSNNAVETLASADAFCQLAGNRFQARWNSSAVIDTTPLFKETGSNESRLKLNSPDIVSSVTADYESFSLSLRKHPIALLRDYEPFRRCHHGAHLLNLRSGQFVRVSGLVTCKQRPGTAKGTMFITLEDESANINLVVWYSLQEKYRDIILNSTLIVANGHVEISESVVHVIAGHLEDYSMAIENVKVKSRNFH